MPVSRAGREIGPLGFHLRYTLEPYVRSARPGRRDANGKPAAVLISPDDLESLEETLTTLSDPVAMEQVRESEQAIAAGEQGASLADLQAQLERRWRDATA